MEEMLMKHGYISQNENEWTKGDWTVRFDKDLVEIFNDPDKAPGKYYTGMINEIKIKDFLEEIDIHLIDKALKEPGIINQINNVPTYTYKKLTIEMIEEAFLKVQKEFEESKEPKFVCRVFGTVEQTTKYMEDFNNAMRNYLKEIK